MPTLVEQVQALAARIAADVKALRAGKADDSAVVHKSGSETVSGVKTFGSAPVVPAGDAPGNPIRWDDPSRTNARTPTLHAGSHAAGQSDAITPASIGAAAANDPRLGAPGPFLTGAVPPGSTTPTIVHGGDTWDVLVQVRDVAARSWVPIANRLPDRNTVELTFTTAPTEGQYRYLLVPFPEPPAPPVAGFGAGPFATAPFGGSA